MKRIIQEIERANNTGAPIDPIALRELIEYAKLLEQAVADRLNYDFEQATTQKQGGPE